MAVPPANALFPHHLVLRMTRRIKDMNVSSEPPLACAAHPDAPVVARCGSCRRGVCRACTVLSVDRGVVCSSCGGCVAPGPRLSNPAKLAAAALTGVVVTWAVVNRTDRAGAPRDSLPAPDAALPEDVETSRLRGSIAKEPCDRVMIVALGEKLIQGGDNRGALRAAASFFHRCGDYSRLRWLTYGAHTRLGEWDAAIAEATKLIAHNRHDRDYWGWRGLAHEEKGDFARAIADYRQALTLEPRLNGLPFNLANLLERVGRPCEAIFPLEQFLHHNSDVDGAAQVRQRILALHESEACGEYAGAGRAIISFTPGAPAVVTLATVNQRHKGRFLIDTGASQVALAAEFARKLGVALGDETVLVRTAGGLASARPVILDVIAVQRASASRVGALVMSSMPPGIDGLLGLSFLSRFEMSMNRQRGRLELAATGRPSRR